MSRAPRAIANRRHGPAHHLAGHTTATSDPEFERRRSILQLDVLFVEHGTAFAESAAGAVQNAVLNQLLGLDDGKRARARKTDCGSRHTEFRLACATLIRCCARRRYECTCRSGWRALRRQRKTLGLG